VEAAGYTEGGPHPVSVSLSLVTPVDDIRCGLSDGTLLFARAKRECGLDRQFRSTVTRPRRWRPCRVKRARPPYAPLPTPPCTAPLQLSGLGSRGGTMLRMARVRLRADSLLTQPKETRGPLISCMPSSKRRLKCCWSSRLRWSWAKLGETAADRPCPSLTPRLSSTHPPASPAPRLGQPPAATGCSATSQLADCHRMGTV
jgi:hypothetical protein